MSRRDDDFVAFVDARSSALMRTARLLTAGDQHAAEDLEAVVRIELPPAVADEALAEHTGTEVDYAVNLWWRAF